MAEPRVKFTVVESDLLATLREIANGMPNTQVPPMKNGNLHRFNAARVAARAAILKAENR